MVIASTTFPPLVDTVNQFLLFVLNICILAYISGICFCGSLLIPLECSDEYQLKLVWFGAPPPVWKLWTSTFGGKRSCPEIPQMLHVHMLNGIYGRTSWFFWSGGILSRYTPKDLVLSVVTWVLVTSFSHEMALGSFDVGHAHHVSGHLWFQWMICVVREPNADDHATTDHMQFWCIKLPPDGHANISDLRNYEWRLQKEVKRCKNGSQLQICNFQWGI